MTDWPSSEFISSYENRTSQSKFIRSRYGARLADSRASAGAKAAIEDILYPIVAQRADGARFWDVDGSEYIDFTMGFGVLLFGHNPEYLQEVFRQIDSCGLLMGPQAELAGEAAELICRMTGVERLCFTNTGTEAVMMAVRLARASLKREKIVLFWGSYHGCYDVTLVRPRGGPRSGSPPVGALGLTRGAIVDTIVLPYCSSDSLEVIDERANEIAAVLVEPVQSRNLGATPAEFLRELRKITSQKNIALIFDDILLGFRIDRRGSQGWFDIDADIVTYGKIVGGGLPIGVVAGSRRFMDAIDGGFQPFGTTVQRVPTTVFLGTFNKNPTTMRLTCEVLAKLEREGAALQTGLSERCAAFVKDLNEMFTSEEVPIAVERFGSIFRFNPKPGLDMFFYYLTLNGIYVWEGKTCFLSLEHNDEILEEAKRRVRRAIEQIRQDGLY